MSRVSAFLAVLALSGCGGADAVRGDPDAPSATDLSASSDVPAARELDEVELDVAADAQQPVDSAAPSDLCLDVMGGMDAPSDAGDVTLDAPDGRDSAEAADVEPPRPDLIIAQVSEDGSLLPLEDGAAVEIVQGPQGGIHIEVALDIYLTAVEPPATIKPAIECELTDRGEILALVKVSKYPMVLREEGTYRTELMPVIFVEHLATHYVGLEPRLVCRVVAADYTLSAVVNLVLVDEETLEL